MHGTTSKTTMSRPTSTNGSSTKGSGYQSRPCVTSVGSPTHSGGVPWLCEPASRRGCLVRKVVARLATRSAPSGDKDSVESRRVDGSAAQKGRAGRETRPPPRPTRATGRNRRTGRSERSEMTAGPWTLRIGARVGAAANPWSWRRTVPRARHAPVLTTAQQPVANRSGCRSKDEVEPVTPKHVAAQT